MICPSCGTENEPGAEVCFTCRAVLAALTQGSVVGARYEILSPLGRGGMGVVYRARDRVLDETVALKVLRSDTAYAAEMLQRFRSEIKLARRVAHGNVCRIYEYGEDGPLQYISMELVEGTNLKEVLRRRGRLPAREAYDVAIQVAEGLEAVHRVGIVHRDLKTLNVMVDRQGAAKVMDFGIAKTVAGGGTPAPSGSYVVGSPEYMSPEQARGQPVDFRSDVYALGVVIFEIFTGRVPFRGDTPVATLLMHLEAPPPLEGPDAAAIPGPLRPVLRRALAKDPSARYPSARELAESLRAALDTSLGPETSGTAPAPPRGRPWIWLAIPIGAAAVMIAVEVRSRVGSPTVPDAGPELQTVAPSPTPAPEAQAGSVQAPSPTPRPARPGPRAPSTAASAVASRAETGPAPGMVASPSPPAAAPNPTPEPASPSPAAAPPAASPTPAPEADGWLLVLVTPWAEVSVDDRPVGQTPLRRIPLRPGSHAVVLTHPDFQPFPRRLTIRPGETVRLVVHLEAEGIRRR